MKPHRRVSATTGLALAGFIASQAGAEALREAQKIDLAVKVRALAFSPDGKTLAGAASDGSVKLWDPRTGALRRAFKSHEGRIGDVSYSGDGATIATCCGEDKTVRLWSARTNAPIRSVEGVGAGAALSPDGRTVAGGVDDRTAGLWDTATGRRLFTFREPVGEIMTAAFAPDGATLAIASSDAEVRFWNTRTGVLDHTLPGLLLATFAVTYSRDGRRLAIGSTDGTISLWNERTRARERTLGQPAGSSVDRLAFSPDGRLLAASRSDTATPSNHEQLELWDVGSGELRQTLTPHEGGIYAVVFSPDGRTLVTSGTDQVLRFWRVGTLAPAAR